MNDDVASMTDGMREALVKATAVPLYRSMTIGEFARYKEKVCVHFCADFTHCTKTHSVMQVKTKKGGGESLSCPFIKESTAYKFMKARVKLGGAKRAEDKIKSI